jgi:amino acid adenylation domain-containing protein
METPCHPYNDSQAWQSQQDCSDSHPFWREWLRGFTRPTPLLQVPASLPEPSATAVDHNEERLCLSYELTDALDGLWRRLNVTATTLVQGAWAVLLARYSGEEDVVFGISRPCGERELHDDASMAGRFSNALPMRACLNPKMPVGDFLQALREHDLAIRPHEQTPLVDIQACSEIPAGRPLFESMVVFENGDKKPLMRAQNRSSSGQAFLALTLLGSGGPQLTLRLRYSPARFHAATVRRMLGHLAQVLRHMVNDSEQPLGSLPLLTDAERYQQLVEWNATDRAFPAERCIHQLFEEQAARTPDALAVIAVGGCLRYGVLNRRADALARYLCATGVHPGDLVGVCLRRSAEMIVGVLAVLKTGAGYVPLDPKYPADRLSFILEETQAPVIVTESSLTDCLPVTTARRVCLDQLGDEPAAANSDNPLCEADPDSRAYVIYTSGSTGQPKGVVLRHRAVVNTLDWVNRTFHVGPGDRLLFVTSLNFDLSVYDIFGTLAAGACIRLASDDELRDPQRLLNILTTEPITFWDSAPAQLRQLVPFFPTLPSDARTHQLRLVFLSGDWIPVALPDQVRSTFPATTVVSLGGATEAAIWSNSYVIGRVDPRWPSIPYGKPIQNARYHILDECLQPVPIGVAGDLYIGGVCLAEGYLNRPELTAQRFIRDPFRGPDDRLYRTGDRARYFADGTIEFLGRIDHQVKVRGFRIELGEIEAVLTQHPAVREVIVTAPPDDNGDRSLVAYIIPHTNERPASADLRRAVAAKLPDYMVPPTFVFLDAWPLSPNGKVDRNALPVPTRTEPEGATTFQPPHDRTEQVLATIWQEVLGLDRIGIEDDFFTLGGHSLKAAQVIARVRQYLQVEIPLPALFRARTIAALAQLVHKNAVVEKSNIPDETLEHEPSRAPASYIQQQLWFLDQLEPGSATYNMGFAVKIHGPLDDTAFQRALSTVVACHEALRTTFTEEDGRLVQRIAPAVTPRVPVTDLTKLNDRDRATELELLTQAQIQEPFDLRCGPLWRAHRVILAPNEQVLLLTVHHIIGDDWSVGTLIRDLVASYGNGADQGACLPPAGQYADFCRRQRQHLQGDHLASLLAYWKRRLTGPLPPLELATSRPRPKVTSSRGAVHEFSLPTMLTRSVRDVSQRLGVTPYMTLLAAFETLLHRLTGQEDLVIGTPVAQRNRVDMERMVGPLINTLVLRLDFPSAGTFRQVVELVRDRVLEAFSHQDLPFDLLVRELHPDRTVGAQPLFQVLFNYLRDASPRLESDGTGWNYFPVPNGTAKFDLTLLLQESADSLQASFEYRTDLFDRGVVERLADQLITLLEGCTAAPDRLVAELPLLTPAERQLILETWNATAVPYPRDRCIHSLFEDQVARTPDRIAVSSGAWSLTYEELNERANQLAHCLRNLGVGPDTLVGLYLERTPDLVLGALGILKAGGAYVPLDPGYPQERLALYLEDSQMEFVVTQRALAERLPELSAREVLIDDWKAIGRHSTVNLPCAGSSESLVYVIYTSGSTGRPKGVQIPHRALGNLLHSMSRQPGLDANDVVLSVTTLSFDIHALELWLPLVCGARVEIASREEASDGVRLMQRLNECGATVLQATPATWRLLLAAGWQGNPRLKALCGGEPMTVDLAEQLVLRVGSLWNMYGPTETTVWSTVHRVMSVDGPIPIGRPIDNTQVYVLDGHGQPLPVGAVGELHIGGFGVARGYLNRPELTAEKFIPDPFRTELGARLYRTGDQARFRPDGTLECLGRTDFQVKIRGHRIELGEVEAVLTRHPAVTAAVVVARQGAGGNDTLAAYVASPPTLEATPEDLRHFLSEKLPAYMVPSAFVRLAALPMTPNGKVDRKALPAPHIGAADAGRTMVAPRTDIERDLAQVWKDVLGIFTLSITDDFFELGGHSFLAAVLMAQIRTRLGHTLPLSTLFEAPTVEKLAAILQQRLEADGSGCLVAFQEEGSRPPLYLIAGVGGHVFTFHKFARLLGPDQPAYGLKAIGVDGRCDPPDRIEDIAARYVEEITARRPTGPYIVGGYSIGALVALELALQLRAAGHQVEMVVVFDMFAPGYPRLLPLGRRLISHFRRLAQLPRGERQTYLLSRLHSVKRRLLKRLGLGVFNAPTIAGLDMLDQATLKKVWTALQTARARYMPQQRFDGKVVLFKSAEVLDWTGAVFDDPLMGWGRWTKGLVETHTVPAGHLELFADGHIGNLAERLREAIDASVRAQLGESVIAGYGERGA